MVFLLLLILTIVCRSISASSICYVKPNNFSTSCPAEPCLTLDEYALQTRAYFTSGATFLFLPGSHILQTTVNLVSVSGITLRGTSNTTAPEIFLKVTGLLCRNVTKLNIEGLTIIHTRNLERTFSSAMILVTSRDVVFSHSTFIGSGDSSLVLARALYCNLSDVIIHQCCFNGSTGSNGGAIFLQSCNATIIGSIFMDNKATHYGGAIYSHASSITLTDDSDAYNSSVTENGGASLCRNIEIDYPIAENESSCILHFTNNEAQLGDGGAIYMLDSKASVSGRNVTFSGNSAQVIGGAICAENTIVTSSCLHLCFTGNRAQGGGAYYGIRKFLTLGENESNNHYFINNSASRAGGAIQYDSGELKIEGNSLFARNSVRDILGGAINVLSSNFSLSGRALFTDNMAEQGGAISIVNSNAVFSGDLIEFVNNSAVIGGAIANERSTVTSQTRHMYFTGNRAENKGGAYVGEEGILELGNTEKHNHHFVNNSAGKEGGAICCQLGSRLAIAGNSFFENNRVWADIGNGGGIGVYHGTTASIIGVSVFTHNSAVGNGGAVYCASSAHITMGGQVNFTLNSAENGGAMSFRSGTSLTLEQKTILTSSFNHASMSGGGIYHEDSITLRQCKFEYGGPRSFELPLCFLKLKGLTAITASYYIFSHYDSADMNGGFLYGGLIDKCEVRIGYLDHSQAWITLYSLILQVSNQRRVPLLEIETNNTLADMITSSTYKLCFCESNQNFNCSEVKTITIHRGQTFAVSLLATGQIDSMTPTTVTAKSPEKGRLRLNQTSQALPENCTALSYNLYSSEENEELVLYADGPCRDTGLAKALINVTLRPCPDAFTQQNEECICEERLRAYDAAECIIGDDVYIKIKGNPKFWMGALYANELYQGLILYRTCPSEYCSQIETVTFNIEELDTQCSQYRSGLLCGACAANYSLMLGSSKCNSCSNTYLVLLVPFAAAGIFLVIFLSVLRLTVATGMINSIILYANVVQANKMLFFPLSRTNVLTVFIAWLNLDFGFQTCFYDGMDAYARTWLQFAFPLYIWFLTGFVIITSRYSISLSKLIGHNPIAVLATLLLMSYTKVLRIIIDVYSFVELEYPGNKTDVWLKDANVPYLQSWHLALTVVSTLVLVFFFLPYTLLLLIGYKLYRFSGRRQLRWLNRIKPLLDSYYAPYQIHTRYWTGFLLLVRCVLYIVFSLYSLRHTVRSLLAINIAFTSVGILSGYFRIYSSNFVNGLEISVYINLIILSVTVSHSNSPEMLVSTLVGIVFATMVVITVYHLHLACIVKSPMWLKIKEKVYSFREVMMKKVDNKNTEILSQPGASSHDPHKMVTKGEIDLREPLLELSS